MSVKTELHELVDRLDDEQAAEAVMYLHRLSTGREDSASQETADQALTRRMGPRVISGREFMAQPRRTLPEIAAEQGVRPVRRLEDPIGDFWPEDESIDDFIAAVREWRHGGSGA
jgi:hypothetical protein